MKFFAKMPTVSTMGVWDNEKSFGVVVAFSEKDFGFGEIAFSVSKETGEAKCDLESMSTKHCGEILMRAVGTEVQDAVKDSTARFRDDRNSS